MKTRTDEDALLDGILKLLRTRGTDSCTVAALAQAVRCRHDFSGLPRNIALERESEQQVFSAVIALHDQGYILYNALKDEIKINT